MTKDRKLSWRLCTNCKASSIPADHTFPLLESGIKLALEEGRAISCSFLINLYQSCKLQTWVRQAIQCMASGLRGHYQGNISLHLHLILMIMESTYTWNYWYHWFFLRFTGLHMSTYFNSDRINMCMKQFQRIKWQQQYLLSFWLVNRYGQI